MCGIHISKPAVDKWIIKDKCSYKRNPPRFNYEGRIYDDGLDSVNGRRWANYGAFRWRIRNCYYLLCNSGNCIIDNLFFTEKRNCHIRFSSKALYIRVHYWTCNICCYLCLCFGLVIVAWYLDITCKWFSFQQGTGSQPLGSPGLFKGGEFTTMDWIL